ncbi:unnamed protein product [Closterium sp. Yama58-4]|nr:unnamed protein product [Closterium sp. Yama58-4]
MTRLNKLVSAQRHYLPALSRILQPRLPSMISVTCVSSSLPRQRVEKCLRAFFPRLVPLLIAVHACLVIAPPATAGYHVSPRKTDEELTGGVQASSWSHVSGVGSIVGSSTSTADIHLAPSQLRALVALNRLWKAWTGNGAMTPACAQWTGVTCDAQGRVTALSVAGVGVSSVIPADIRMLTALQQLDLSYNYFSKALPLDAFAQLKQLKALNLSYNMDLTGSINILTSLPLLQQVDLSNTQISGSIPSAISSLSHLRHLDLTLTQVSGSLPATMSQLSALSYLSLRQVYNLKGAMSQYTWLSLLTNLHSLDITGAHKISGELSSISLFSSLRSLRRLTFSDMHMWGELPVSLALLQNLTYLDLSYLRFKQLPFWLTALSELRYLDVTHEANLRTGAVPQDLSLLSHLEFFKANGNGLVGFLPESWGSLTNLTTLSLEYNHLVGSIPRHFSSLRSLKTLNLGLNQLSGSLPNVFSPTLESLQLGGNRFQGSIPSFLGSLTLLTNLELRTNGFTGAIPAQFTALTGLTELFLMGNFLSSGVEVISHMDWLYMLDLTNNSFSGSLPASFSRLTSLDALNLAYNNFGGTFPSVLLTLTQLGLMDLSYNNFEGSLPTELTSFKNLIYLYMDGNHMVGEIPPGLFLSPNINDLSFAHNNLQGSLPPHLSTSTSLSMLKLEGNSLSGPLPDFNAWRNTTLNALYLGFNNLTGPIPDSISVLTSLYTLTLQGNQLSGSLPSGLGAVNKLNVLWMADNALSGPLPEFLGQLNATVQLLLDGNAFEGQLPAAICNLTALEAIGLSNNRLYGSFPTCLFNFPALNYVDMSNNSFYGPINMDFVGMVAKPTSGFTKPAVINLAHNYFYGDPVVYAGGFKACPTPHITRINMSDLNSLGDSAGGSKRSDSQSMKEAVQCFQAYATVQASYKGNCLSVNRQVKCSVTEVQRDAEECAAFCSVTDLGPCNGRGACVPPAQGDTGGAFRCSCEAPYVTVTVDNGSTCAFPTETTKSSIPTIGIVGLSCLLGIALLASVLCLLLRPKKKKRWSDLDVCQQFSIATMRKATNDWAEENVLGEGGFAVVYKGVNPTTGQLWAVKRITLMSNDFETEVRAMASLHHANLVRLLGFCHDMDMESGKQEQILVYEFVEHGDLSFHLFKTQKPLTLRQRLKLAVGAAEGLAYLHGFENPIIHRDIKPANILVGDNLTAKVADFGLLRKLKFGEGEGRATKVAGTPGYVDPDYNRTELVTTKSDVYSFGVVLLEMLSGRRVTVEGNTHIGKWATALVQSYSLDELKDRRMEASEDAVVELADLALDCIKMPGIRRPEMKDVLRRLDAMLTAHTVEEEDENVVGDLFSAFSVGSVGEAGSVGIGGSAGTFGSTTTGASATTIGSAGVPVSGTNAAGAPSQRDERYSEIVAEREDGFQRHSVESESQSYISQRTQSAYITYVKRAFSSLLSLPINPPNQQSPLGPFSPQPILTHPLLQDCTEGSGALFNATWEQGALTRGTVRWTPASNRFLLAHCVRGQVTNRLLCLRNHMLLAGLLNRTLIIPFHRSETILNYDLHLVLDLAYLRSCIGPTVFTTAEFRRKFRQPVQVSQVVCWHGPPGACVDQIDNILLHCPGLDDMRRSDGSGSGGNNDMAAGDAAGAASGGDGGGLAGDGGSGMVAGTPGVVFDTRVPVSHSLFRSPLVHLPPNTTTHAACLPMLASQEQVSAFLHSPASPYVPGSHARLPFPSTCISCSSLTPPNSLLLLTPPAHPSLPLLPVVLH